MADFVQSNETKSAVRKLTDPIADIATFNTIVQSVVTSNPFACVAYMTAGVNHPAVEKTKETYVAKVIYQDSRRQDSLAMRPASSTRSPGSLPVPRQSSATQPSRQPMAAHPPGTATTRPSRQPSSATTRTANCTSVTFSRDQVTLTSYSDDAIRTKVETWADSVAALA